MLRDCWIDGLWHPFPCGWARWVLFPVQKRWIPFRVVVFWLGSWLAEDRKWHPQSHTSSVTWGGTFPTMTFHFSGWWFLCFIKCPPRCFCLLSWWFLYYFVKHGMFITIYHHHHLLGIFSNHRRVPIRIDLLSFQSICFRGFLGNATVHQGLHLTSTWNWMIGNSPIVTFTGWAVFFLLREKILCFFGWFLSFCCKKSFKKKAPTKVGNMETLLSRPQPPKRFGPSKFGEFEVNRGGWPCLFEANKPGRFQNFRAMEGGKRHSSGNSQFLQWKNLVV